MDASLDVERTGTPHVVIIGAGFGGLTAAKALGRADVRVTVIDRVNHHLFQPLLYQVAIAGLSPADIASPIRSVLRRQPNTRVLLGEVESVDVGRRQVLIAGGERLAYDYLIVACGARTSYFGHDEWESAAPGLKSVEDAIEIRRRVLTAFEQAERTPQDVTRLLSFVVVGGGPTGVELAGAIAELSRQVLKKEFRAIDPTRTRVVLVEAGERILAPFHPSMSEKAVEQLHALGVEVRAGTKVTQVDPAGVTIANAQGTELLAAATVVWAAGVMAVPLVAALAKAVKAVEAVEAVEGESPGRPLLDRGGRMLVEPDCSVPGHPEVFVIGDAAAFLHAKDGKPLPGVSPVAIQQANFVAQIVRGERAGRPRGRFAYFDKGLMATIGRSRAVVQAGSWRMSGFIAWLMWLLVHIWYLIGFRNRLVVMLNWAWSYWMFRRGARLITSAWSPRLLAPRIDG